MFRTLSIPSGSTLLRRPLTLIYNARSYRLPSTNPPKQAQKTPKAINAGDIKTTIIEDEPDQTQKPKRKYTRRKIQTGPDADIGAAELAKDGGQGVADGKKSKTKKIKKSKSISILEPEPAKDDKEGATDATLKKKKKVKKSKGVKSVNNLAQLASEARNEKGLLRYLNAAYAPRTRKAAGGVNDSKRVHVISRSLCDDTLERLKPSLEKHIGCDILDLNPGPGLWSSTLHDFLKPRTHILMEPDPAAYKPLLQPLLEAEGSTYKLVPKSGVIWNTLQETLSAELLPHQESLKNGDPRLEKQNNTLLLVANLGYFPKKGYRGFSSITSLVIYQLLSAARSNSLFHKYGPIRMLLWVDDEAKRTVLPRSVLQRMKSSVEAELTCSDINEVISATDNVGLLRRDHVMDLESSIATVERMKEGGIITPTNRRWPMEIEATESISKGHDKNFKLYRYFYPELNELERQFAAGEITMYKDTPKDSQVKGAGSSTVVQSTELTPMAGITKKQENLYKKGKPMGLERRRLAEKYTPEYARLHWLRGRKKEAGRQESRVEALSEEFDVIISMWKKVKTLEGPAAEGLQKEADVRYNAMMNEVSTTKFKAHISGIVHHMLDNRIAYNQDPSLLYWDRRRAEPLKANQEEFFPKSDMALLDFQPHSIWPTLRENFPANYDVLEYILSTLFMVPSQSVRQGLTSLAPGAFEWLLQECPSITDPRKGGSSFVGEMTVRCLNLEMLQEILEAWLKWPFQPSRYELLSKMGSDIYDPAAIDNE